MTTPQPRRPTTIRRHQALHTRLVDAAEASIAQHGLPGLRARTLAETVGCSVGAIYGIVPDLDALILAVNARTLEALDQTMQAPAPDPATQLTQIAEAYLDYAARNGPRWATLMQHRLPENQHLPDWYATSRAKAFAHIEAPLAALQPALAPEARALLAQTLFAAVHGMVALGLEQKLAPTSLDTLKAQLRTVVAAIARGLATT